MPGSLAVSTDVARLAKMIYGVEGNWGDECPETARQFFHEQNVAVAVRGSLGISLCGGSDA